MARGTRAEEERGEEWREEETGKKERKRMGKKGVMRGRARTAKVQVETAAKLKSMNRRNDTQKNEPADTQKRERTHEIVSIVSPLRLFDRKRNGKRR